MDQNMSYAVIVSWYFADYTCLFRVSHKYKKMPTTRSLPCQKKSEISSPQYDQICRGRQFPQCFCVYAITFWMCLVNHTVKQFLRNKCIWIDISGWGKKYFRCTEKFLDTKQNDKFCYTSDSCDLCSLSRPLSDAV